MFFSSYTAKFQKLKSAFEAQFCLRIPSSLRRENLPQHPSALEEGLALVLHSFDTPCPVYHGPFHFCLPPIALGYNNKLLMDLSKCTVTAASFSQSSNLVPIILWRTRCSIGFESCRRDVSSKNHLHG